MTIEYKVDADWGEEVRLWVRETGHVVWSEVEVDEPWENQAEADDYAADESYVPAFGYTPYGVDL